MRQADSGKLRARIRFDFEPQPRVRDNHSFRQAVMRLLDDRRRIEKTIEADGVDAARADANGMVRNVATLAKLILGDEILDIALLKDRPDEDPLLVAWHRLQLASPLIGGGQDDFYLALHNEIVAVLAGDAPQLFRRRSTRRGKDANVAYQVAHVKLEALKWDAFFTAFGEQESGRMRITNAFGQSSWDTVRKWKGPCEIAFGREHVAAALAAATVAGDCKKRNQAWSRNVFATPKVEDAGADYQRIMRETA